MGVPETTQLGEPAEVECDSVQLALPAFESIGSVRQAPRDPRRNLLNPRDRAFHDWYRFILSFPPHLVRSYLKRFNLNENHVVLDPFCGTGTTLVEAKLRRVRAIGLEANPLAHLASSVKVNWDVDPVVFLEGVQEVGNAARGILREQGIDDARPFHGDLDAIPLRTLDREASRLVIKNSISPLPLHKTLVLLECLRRHREDRWYEHALLALANALVFSISNLRFGPEVGAGKKKDDVQVVGAWLRETQKIARDLRGVAGQDYPQARAYLADARSLHDVLEPSSVDAVITSPPYPNEKDYTRTTRLESVILGYFTSRSQLRALKKTLVRSNTRGVYKDDDDDEWVADHPQIQHIADEIEKRRQELGKTSGFERMYARVTRLYFGGLARHLAGLRVVLRPGARLAYVVGDQASYLRIMIPTGRLLADIAEGLGYQLEQTDLFRTRFATATREQLREEVVVLRWPGR